MLTAYKLLGRFDAIWAAGEMLNTYKMLGRFDAILGRWRDVDRF